MLCQNIETCEYWNKYSVKHDLHQLIQLKNRERLLSEFQMMYS